jgi:hypothetical protein
VKAENQSSMEFLVRKYLEDVAPKQPKAKVNENVLNEIYSKYWKSTRER